jgi:hypothetical protein
MGRISRKPLMVVSSLALATATAVGTIAAPAQAATIVDLPGQRRALYQSELEQNLLLRTQLGYGLIAEYGPLRLPPAGANLTPGRSLPASGYATGPKASNEPSREAVPGSAKGHTEPVPAITGRHRRTP